MAKKKKTTKQNLKSPLSGDSDMPSKTELMFFMFANGITVEDYVLFTHNMMQAHQEYEKGNLKPIVEIMSSIIDQLDEDEINKTILDATKEVEDMESRGGILPKVEHWADKKTKPAKGTDNKTLKLKIQMANVQKPPMWREVEVPAYYTFAQLHAIIQAVTGLEDYHAWQFTKKPYDHGVSISDTERLDSATHDAYETKITEFLHRVGDKFTYTYDFGDDWIFSIELKKIDDRKSEHPVMTGWKSDLNCLEDTGGPWSYCSLRNLLDPDAKLTKKEKEEIAEMINGDADVDEAIETLQDSLIDPPLVAETLRDI